MPQASSDLQAEWPGMDSEALDHLHPNFRWALGFIEPRSGLYEPTERDWSAINYLIDEWDYGYMPLREPGQAEADLPESDLAPTGNQKC